MTAVEHPASFPSPRSAWRGLALLATVVAFAVLTEGMPTGLLPEMAAGLRVPQPQVGLLVTVFAVTVSITCVPLVLLTRRFDRRALIVIATAGLGLSTLGSALVPGYDLVAVTRVVGGLSHGLFWSVVGAYVGHVLPPERLARGVALVLGGTTVGAIVGVPIATLVGQTWGWRVAFGAVGVLMLVAAALVRWLLSPAAGSGAVPIRRDRTVVPTLLLCAAAFAIMTGNYAFYTYIAPFLVDVGGLASGAVAVALLVCGAAGALGLLLAARFGRRLVLGSTISLATSAASIVLLLLAEGRPVPSLVAIGLWAVAFGMLPALLQNAILVVASPAFRDIGSAVYTATFNLGIGGGAALGALVYTGAGIAAVPYPYLAILAASTLVAAALVARERVEVRRARRAAPIAE